MDRDIEYQYLTAERAYGAGDFEAAQSICESLLRQLKLRHRNSEQKIMLAWRAIVALLMGNIQLYGVGDLEKAAHHYKLVLESKPKKTLLELAEQGWDRCQSELQGQPPQSKSEECAPCRSDEQPEASHGDQAKANTSKRLTEMQRYSLVKANRTVNHQGKETDSKPFLEQQVSIESWSKHANSEPLTDLTRDPFIARENTGIITTTTEGTKTIWQESTTSKKNIPTTLSEEITEQTNNKTTDQQLTPKMDKEETMTESEIIEQVSNKSETLIGVKEGETRSQFDVIKSEAAVADVSITRATMSEKAKDIVDILKSESELFVMTDAEKGPVKANHPLIVKDDIAQELLKDSIMQVMMPSKRKQNTQVPVDIQTKRNAN